MRLGARQGTHNSTLRSGTMNLELSEAAYTLPLESTAMPPLMPPEKDWYHRFRPLVTFSAYSPDWEPTYTAVSSRDMAGAARMGPFNECCHTMAPVTTNILYTWKSSEPKYAL